MKRTYLDSSVLIQAVQGVDGDKTAALLEDPEREFVAATFLKLELLPQSTFHKRKAEWREELLRRDSPSSLPKEAGAVLNPPSPGPGRSRISWRGPESCSGT